MTKKKKKQIEIASVFELNTPLSKTGLKLRTMNVIEELTGKSINDLVISDLGKYSEEELRNCRKVGQKTITEIISLLNSVGISIDKYIVETFPINTERAIFHILSVLHRTERKNLSDQRDFRNWLRKYNLLDE